jgi:sugar lactone lactonase YvrE
LAMPLEGIVVDSTGEIYVADQWGSVILGFPPNSNGDVSPNLAISGASTGLKNPTGLALDGSGNLYVANSEWPPCRCRASIEEFAAGANGDVAPRRVISGRRADLVQPQGIAVAVNGEIYVTDVGKSPVKGPDDLPKIEVFSKSASGDVSPTRRIIGNRTRLWAIPEGLAVDRDGAYTGMWNKGLIERFSLTANGDAHPQARIEGSDTDLELPLDGVTTATDGSIYVVDRGGQLPEILQFAGRGRGNAKPLSNITGSNTRLDIPLFVFVAEQPSS